MSDGWDDDDFVPPPEEDCLPSAGSKVAPHPSQGGGVSKQGKSIFSIDDTQSTIEGTTTVDKATDDGNCFPDVLDFGGDDFFDDVERPFSSTQQQQHGRQNPPCLSIVSPIRQRDAILDDENHDEETVIFNVLQGGNDDVSPSATTRRKFPGPAGIMPRIHPALDSQPSLAHLLAKRSGGSSKYNGSSSEQRQQTKTLSLDSHEWRGLEELVHRNEAWQRMLKNRQRSSSGDAGLLDKFNINYIKQQMKVSNMDIKRSPVLVAAVQSLDLSHSDSATCRLLDPSGTISGMIDGDVMTRYGVKLQPGSVLVLTNITVLQTVCSHYVNITNKNVAELYWNNASATSPNVIPGVFSEVVVRISDDQVMQMAGQLEMEERQVAERAEAFAKQAAALAKGPIWNPPPPPPPRSRFAIASPMQVGSVIQAPLMAVPRCRPPKRSMPCAPPRFHGPNPNRPVCDSSSAAMADGLLDGLDEESIFGDF